MNKELLEQLIALKDKDASTRQKLLDAGKLYGVYDEEMQQVHRENAQALSDIVSEHGWPGESEVGLEGCRAAWLIAQNSICTPDLQRRFLIYLSMAVEVGNAPKKQVAFLTDRIRYNEGGFSVYGTVLNWDEKGVLGCDLENPYEIDKVRKTLGLPPYEESLEENRIMIEAEGGKPPEDYHAFQQAEQEWAESVGWR